MCYYNIMLLCYCAIVRLCYCAIVPLCYCAIVLLCYCAIVLLCYCAIVPLCYCAIVLLCHCAIVLLCYCAIVLLCHCAIVLLFEILIRHSKNNRSAKKKIKRIGYFQVRYHLHLCILYTFPCSLLRMLFLIISGWPCHRRDRYLRRDLQNSHWLLIL